MPLKGIRTEKPILSPKPDWIECRRKQEVHLKGIRTEKPTVPPKPEWIEYRRKQEMPLKGIKTEKPTVPPKPEWIEYKINHESQQKRDRTKRPVVPPKSKLIRELKINKHLMSKLNQSVAPYNANILLNQPSPEKHYGANDKDFTNGNVLCITPESSLSTQAIQTDCSEADVAQTNDGLGKFWFQHPQNDCFNKETHDNVTHYSVVADIAYDTSSQETGRKKKIKKSIGPYPDVPKKPSFLTIKGKLAKLESSKCASSVSSMPPCTMVKTVPEIAGGYHKNISDEFAHENSTSIAQLYGAGITNQANFNTTCAKTLQQKQDTENKTTSLFVIPDCVKHNETKLETINTLRRDLNTSEDDKVELSDFENISSVNVGDEPQTLLTCIVSDQTNMTSSICTLKRQVNVEVTCDKVKTNKVTLTRVAEIKDNDSIMHGAGIAPIISNDVSLVTETHKHCKEIHSQKQKNKDANQQPQTLTPRKTILPNETNQMSLTCASAKRLNDIKDIDEKVAEDKLTVTPFAEKKNKDLSISTRTTPVVNKYESLVTETHKHCKEIHSLKQKNKDANQQPQTLTLRKTILPDETNQMSLTCASAKRLNDIKDTDEKVAEDKLTVTLFAEKKNKDLSISTRTTPVVNKYGSLYSETYKQDTEIYSEEQSQKQVNKDVNQPPPLPPRMYKILDEENAMSLMVPSAKRQTRDTDYKQGNEMCSPAQVNKDATRPQLLPLRTDETKNISSKCKSTKSEIQDSSEKEIEDIVNTALVEENIVNVKQVYDQMSGNISVKDFDRNTDANERNETLTVPTSNYQIKSNGAGFVETILYDGGQLDRHVDSLSFNSSYEEESNASGACKQSSDTCVTNIENESKRQKAFADADSEYLIIKNTRKTRNNREFHIPLFWQTSTNDNLIEQQRGVSSNSYLAPVTSDRLGDVHETDRLCMAKCDYTPSAENNLELVRGTIYEILDQPNEYLWKVKNKFGESGYIPSNHVSTRSELAMYSWYYKGITTEECDAILNVVNKDGCFMIRDACTQVMTYMYSLSVFCGIRVYNYHIKNSTGRFCLNERANHFDTIPELVKYHKQFPGSLQTLLTSPPPLTYRVNPDKIMTNAISNRWKIDEDDLETGAYIGSGSFGRICRGTLRGSAVATEEIPSTQLTHTELSNEFSIMLRLSHTNLLHLYGVVTDSEPMLKVTELIEYGNLAAYLSQNKHSLMNNFSVLISMCLQICLGMEYLHSRGYIHGCLAAKSCRVGTNLTVKIADLLGAKHVEEGKTVQFSKCFVKWAPPEVIRTGLGDKKADVWSFGTLMWEIFTCGKEPYAHMTNEEYKQNITTLEDRLPKPAACPMLFYSNMMACWNKDPWERPTFRELFTCCSMTCEDYLEPQYSDTAVSMMEHGQFSNSTESLNSLSTCSGARPKTPPKPGPKPSAQVIKQAREKKTSLYDIEYQDQQTQKIPGKHKVLYPYTPDHEDDLRFNEGDIVTVLQKCTNGWYAVELNGQLGYIPKAYLEKTVLHASIRSELENMFRPPESGFLFKSQKKTKQAIETFDTSNLKHAETAKKTGWKEAISHDKAIKELGKFDKLSLKHANTAEKTPLPDKEADDDRDANEKRFVDSNAEEAKSKDTLPSAAGLAAICQAHGRKSDTVKRICGRICDNIKDECKHIVNVWPAYPPNEENNIVFCVITDIPCERISCIYSVLQRAIGEYSAEECAILKQESERGLTFTDDAVENCIESNADKYMDNHKNVSVISASLLKSKRFGTPLERVSQTVCIVFLVPIKGLIPLSEEAFPTYIDEFPVDVREGSFRYKSGGKPNDRHESLKMGCAIQGDEPGTLGGFLDHNEHGICCLTAAHVMLSGKKMKETFPGPYVPASIESCYQPEPPNAFGRLIKAIAIEGSENKTGIDVALVKIDERIPLNGRFPDAEEDRWLEVGYSPTLEMQYSTGVVLERVEIPRGKLVLKFGQATTLTEGVVRLRGFAVRNVNFHDNSEGYRYSLKKQIQVRPIVGVPFSEDGDSGSLVFVRGNDGQLSAIGMLVGGTDNYDVVTPICDILREIDTALYLKPFPCSI